MSCHSYLSSLGNVTKATITIVEARTRSCRHCRTTYGDFVFSYFSERPDRLPALDRSLKVTVRPLGIAVLGQVHPLISPSSRHALSPSKKSSICRRHRYHLARRHEQSSLMTLSRSHNRLKVASRVSEQRIRVPREHSKSSIYHVLSHSM